jgi:anaerobic selenocysteine-containing dehydrogenase
MANLMLKEDLADLDYARAVCADFHELVAQVSEWTPERASQASGVEAETIIRLAREFAKARPATIRAGVGPQQSRHGEHFLRAIHALAILGGHWRLRGGGAFTIAFPPLNEVGAEREDLIPAGTSPRRLDMARLGEILTDPSLDPPIKGLMIWCTNPVLVQPDANRVKQGLERKDLFTVVIEHFMTDTARYADLVLPSTTQLEHFDLLGAWGHSYVTINHPAIEPLGEAVSHGEIMRLLAAGLDLYGAPLRESDEEIAASALPANVNLDTLKAAGWIKTEFRRPRLEGAGVRLASGIPEPAKAEPGMLQLLTPKAHFFLNSSFVNQPRNHLSQGQPRLDMAPIDAAGRGLRDGEFVLIRNRLGLIGAELRITDAVPPGTVSLVGKWWGASRELSAAANLLCASVHSPAGQPAYNDIFVEVVKGDHLVTAEGIGSAAAELP